MRKTIMSLVAVSILIPSLAYASWWNPFTWKIFNRSNSIPSGLVSEIIPASVTPKQYLSKDQIQKIIDSSPRNVKIEDTIQGLLDRGYVLQGYNDKEEISIVTSNSESSTEETLNTEIKEKKAEDKKIQKTVEKKETENFNFLVIQLNESLTNLMQEYLDLNIKIKAVMQERLQRNISLKAELQSHVVESVPQGVNVPNDLYRSLVKYVQNDSELVNLSISKEQTIINGLSGLISKFKEFKTIEQTKFYSRDQAVTKMKEMMGAYDALDTFSNYTNATYSEFNEDVEKSDTIVQNALAALKKNADEYVSKNSIPSVQYSQIPKIVIPKVEFPKTTNCSVRGTGVSGSYSISCTESSF